MQRIYVIDFQNIDFDLGVALTKPSNFNSDSAGLAIDLNNRLHKLEHKFVPYLAPAFLDQEGYYGVEQRTLLSDERHFEVDQKSLVFRSKVLDDLEREVCKIANSICAKALMSKITLRNGATLTAAMDGVITTDATTGLLVEHVSAAFEGFDDFTTNGALFITRAERERFEMLSAYERTTGIHVQHGLATHVLGARLTVLPDHDLPANYGERYCIALSKGGLFCQIEWSVNESKGLSAKISAVRADGNLVHLIRTIR